ncbi:xanthine dehydrogenase family protein molybdopterin-binding subunit [Pseudooceanicola algae]|uniref:4-hydroxybenzoyl-CoA reductase subunit alpha n=1 Tax=Pseudooceanicola algae TaxID=1537215 RepID=A0A418SLF3_9RHOB|nr:xanthine dehydrogenase family protein molybdopterin-binding subunit [Pseudooceanicola algae]QPM90573.1 4-hydroxybenzoyl-CoA reductase subunit alpha [Pseudooceanicola algae]
MSEQKPLRVVGQPIERADAHAKVTGRARYTVDLAKPGMLHAKVLRSPHAHARVVSIDTTRADTMPGVRAVATGPKLAEWVAMPVYGYFIKDQPILAMDRVRYEGDMVAAVAADTEAQANDALAAIRVVYEELPALPGIDAALDEEAPELFPEPPRGVVPPYGEGASAKLWPRKNVCYAFRYTTGEADVFDGCDHVFEDEFRFSRMHHMHLEPFVCLAEWLEGDEIEVATSCQNPFPLRKEIARIFRVPENRISVKVPFVGGGFGAKNNCKTEPLALVLSKMTGRPVRFCMTMEEAFLTNTQHAAVLKLKTGVMADGTLVARQSHILLDSGAYSDASPLVAEKAGYRITGPYRYKHVDSVCECVLTTTTPSGPYRGFGGTQATWASESQIDMIARRLGIDPMEMRLKNLVALHEPWMPGESGVDSDMAEGLALVAEAIGYGAHKKAEPGWTRGHGLAIGFKDGGGVNKPAQARVKVSTGGDIHLMCGTVEIGQGARTALSQVVAEILGAPLKRVEYLPLDTRYTPFDQGTNASSAITVMGQAVQRAAVSVRDQVLQMAAEHLGTDVAALELEDWTIRHGNEAHPLAPIIMHVYGGTGFEFTGDGFHKQANDHHAPLETKSVFWEIGWAGVDLSVDRETGQVKIHALAVSGDAGRAIHRLICRGQDEGAALMGLGQAMFEQMIYDGSRLINGEALMYRVPLAEDLPEQFTSILQEQEHGPGPFGAKGMGEGTMLPVPPAIANAIQDAVGVRITDLPLTPERVLAAIIAAES